MPEISKNSLGAVQTHTACQPATAKVQEDTHIRTHKDKRSQINNLILQLKKLKKEQTKPKANGRKEVIKIRAEITKIENR